MKANTQKANIILIDGDERFRQGLAFYLSKIMNVNLVAEVSDINSYKKLKNKEQANLLMIGVNIQNFNGLAILRKNKKEDCYEKIIAITNNKNRIRIQGLINLGLEGCIFKKYFFDELKIAIPAIFKGRNYYSEGLILSDSLHQPIEEELYK